MFIFRLFYGGKVRGRFGQGQSASHLFFKILLSIVSSKYLFIHFSFSALNSLTVCRNSVTNKPNRRPSPSFSKLSFLPKSLNPSYATRSPSVCFLSVTNLFFPSVLLYCVAVDVNRLCLEYRDSNCYHPSHNPSSMSLHA